MIFLGIWSYRAQGISPVMPPRQWWTATTTRATAVGRKVSRLTVTVTLDAPTSKPSACSLKQSWFRMLG